jgi:hypothetical protein
VHAEGFLKHFAPSLPTHTHTNTPLLLLHSLLQSTHAPDGGTTTPGSIVSRPYAVAPDGLGSAAAAQLLLLLLLCPNHPALRFLKKALIAHCVINETCDVLTYN